MMAVVIETKQTFDEGKQAGEKYLLVWWD